MKGINRVELERQKTDKETMKKLENKIKDVEETIKLNRQDNKVLHKYLAEARAAEAASSAKKTCQW